MAMSGGIAAVDVGSIRNLNNSLLEFMLNRLCPKYALYTRMT